MVLTSLRRMPGAASDLRRRCRIGAINVSLPAIQWLAHGLGWGLPVWRALGLVLGLAAEG